MVVHNSLDVKECGVSGVVDRVRSDPTSGVLRGLLCACSKPFRTLCTDSYPQDSRHIRIIVFWRVPSVRQRPPELDTGDGKGRVSGDSRREFMVQGPSVRKER